VVSVVCDAVIVVRALINPYSYWGRLLFEHATEYRLIVSPPILAEVLEVIQRPRLTRKYRMLATRDPATVLALLAAAEIIEIEAIPAVSRDPKDDKYLATAALAGADYLVSEDEDLLVIGEYQGVTIVDGRTFLHLLEQRPS
jgi:putative PIN family toxin of toxin-antitoxin system